MNKIAVVVARIQATQIPQEIHELISGLQLRYDSVGVVLGRHRTGATRRNPLDAELRTAMLRDAFPAVTVLSIDDQPVDEKWSRDLDELIASTFGQHVDLYGSKDGLASRYTGTHSVTVTGDRHVDTLRDVNEVRSRNLNVAAFREGVLFALSQTYPKVYPTVDIAVFRNNRAELLLGMKSNDNRWRLPGGFADPTDQRYEDAALRELGEECGLTSVAGLAYEGSFHIDDWRYRYEEDKIITILFSAAYSGGVVKASDDLEEVRWFSLDDIVKLAELGKTAPEHAPLLNFLLSKYLKKQ